MAATNKGLNLLPSETYHIHVSETRCGTDLSRFSRFYVPPPPVKSSVSPSKPGRARAARHELTFSSSTYDKIAARFCPPAIQFQLIYCPKANRLIDWLIDSPAKVMETFELTLEYPYRERGGSNCYIPTSLETSSDRRGDPSAIFIHPRVHRAHNLESSVRRYVRAGVHGAHKSWPEATRTVSQS